MFLDGSFSWAAAPVHGLLDLRICSFPTPAHEDKEAWRWPLAAPGGFKLRCHVWWRAHHRGIGHVRMCCDQVNTMAIAGDGGKEDKHVRSGDVLKLMTWTCWQSWVMLIGLKKLMLTEVMTNKMVNLKMWTHKISKKWFGRWHNYRNQLHNLILSGPALGGLWCRCSWSCHRAWKTCYILFGREWFLTSDNLLETMRCESHGKHDTMRVTCLGFILTSAGIYIEASSNPSRRKKLRIGAWKTYDDVVEQAWTFVQNVWLCWEALYSWQTSEIYWKFKEL